MKIYREISTGKFLTENMFVKKAKAYISEFKARTDDDSPSVEEVMLNDDDVWYVGEIN